MNSSERESVSVTLCRLWPGKFRDEELVDLCDRLDRFRPRDVLAALNDHKNGSKWRPQASEILARLKGKEVRTDGEPGRVDDSLCKAVRSQRPDLNGASDFEVLLRYWRSDWFRYKANADQRRGQMPDTMHAEHDERVRGYRIRDARGCAYALAGAGMTTDEAEKWAETIFEPDPGFFRQCLGQLRGPDPADPFRDSDAA